MCNFTESVIVFRDGCKIKSMEGEKVPGKRIRRKTLGVCEAQKGVEWENPLCHNRLAKNIDWSLRKAMTAECLNVFILISWKDFVSMSF